MTPPFPKQLVNMASTAASKTV